jgi:hypothetical protein
MTEKSRKRMEWAKKVVAEALATFKGTLQDHNIIQTAFQTILSDGQAGGAPPTPSAPTDTEVKNGV